MKERIGFVLNTMGWLMIFAALMMGAVYGVSSDYRLYYDLQMRENTPGYAGVSSDDLLMLDERLADYLFAPMNADMAFDNREIEVHGEMQQPFNEKELIHLQDCRRLLSITVRPVCYGVLAGLGLILVLRGKRKIAAAWTAAALILLPLGILGIWAAVDFSSAFTLFHKLLFTNDLWLLDPRTDLLINICPASMFANIGLRIGLCIAAVLLGIPALLTIFKRRKRKAK